MEKQNLVGYALKELTEVAKQLNLPKFQAKEIATWLYKRKVSDFNQMTTLSNATREQLKNEFEIRYTEPSKVHISKDGTKKYLFPTYQGRFIEAAYIPDKNRNTLCVSSQVGCKMGCKFCMTARMGFLENLTAGEIINQIASIPERDEISNLVFMGMGEPLDNVDEVLKALEILTADYGLGFSPKKITVSTIGVLPGMRKFIDHSSCQLAISLHSPFNEERLALMPVQKKYSIEDIMLFLRKERIDKQRRVSFEYILFKGLNDTPRHVKQLARLLNGLRCRINLIRFHAIPDAGLVSTTDEDLEEFKHLLERKDITTTIRASRGEDIMAACGLLSTKEYTSG